MFICTTYAILLILMDNLPFKAFWGAQEFILKFYHIFSENTFEMMYFLSDLEGRIRGPDRFCQEFDGRWFSVHPDQMRKRKARTGYVAPKG